MGNWNSCQRRSKSVISFATLLWVSIYFFQTTFLLLFLRLRRDFTTFLFPTDAYRVYFNAHRVSNFHFSLPLHFRCTYIQSISQAQEHFNLPKRELSIYRNHELSIYRIMNFRFTVSNFNLPTRELSIYCVEFQFTDSCELSIYCVEFQFTESWTFNLLNHEISIYRITKSSISICLTNFNLPIHSIPIYW